MKLKDLITEQNELNESSLGKLGDKIYSKWKGHLDKMIKQLEKEYNLSPEVAAIALERILNVKYTRGTKPKEDE